MRNQAPKIAKWCVYLHRNMVNQKVYIGITCNKPSYRWNEGRGYKAQKHFWRAIQKYGWDTFEHIILASNLSEREAKTMEIQMIAEYQSMNPEYGYNQTAGGDGMLGWHHSETSRAKIIHSNKNRVVTEKTRKKQSDSHKGMYTGEKNPFYGKKHTDETKRIISERNTGNHHEISAETRQKISQSKKGKYVGENAPWYGRKHTEEQKKKISEANRRVQNLPEVKAKKSKALSGINNPMYGKLPATAKSVVQYTKDGKYVATYSSAMLAKKETGISNASIGSCCKGRSKSAGGFLWKYAVNENRWI